MKSYGVEALVGRMTLVIALWVGCSVAVRGEYQAEVLRSFNAMPPSGLGLPVGLTEGSDGQIYGITEYGGAGGGGVVFKLSPDGANFEVIHSFGTRLIDAYKPNGRLLQA